jgi:hypothetical protein
MINFDHPSIITAIGFEHRFSMNIHEYPRISNWKKEKMYMSVAKIADFYNNLFIPLSTNPQDWSRLL